MYWVHTCNWLILVCCADGTEELGVVRNVRLRAACRRGVFLIGNEVVLSDTGVVRILSLLSSSRRA